MVIICEWFAMRTNETDKVIDHPIVGWTPCCGSCAAKFDMTDELVPFTTTED